MIDVLNECIAAHHGNQRERDAYRDKVAFMAMEKLFGELTVVNGDEGYVAKSAYRMADAMLAAKEKVNT